MRSDYPGRDDGSGLYGSKPTYKFNSKQLEGPVEKTSNKQNGKAPSVPRLQLGAVNESHILPHKQRNVTKFNTHEGAPYLPVDTVLSQEAQQDSAGLRSWGGDESHPAKIVVNKKHP